MIIGEIKRYLRDNNSIRVSRSIRDLAYKAMQFKEKYIRENGKEPTIDIIAKEAEYLCFIEVKYRRDRQCGDPLEAVDYRKQKNIVQTALYYMMKNGLNEWTPCRFDVVSVCGGQVRIIKNAFEGV